MAVQLDALFYAPNAAPRFAPGSRHVTGGVETQVGLLTRELARRGGRIGVVAIERGEALPEMIDGVRLLAQRPAPPAGPLRPLLGALRLLGAMRGVRTRTVVQSGAGPVLLYLAAIARLRRWRLVYASASRWEFEAERHGSRIAAALFRLGVRMANQVVVQHAEQVELCRSRFGREPVMIHYVAEPAPIRTGLPEFFLWIGRLEQIKRPHDFVALARRLPDLPFKMIASVTRPGASGLVPQLERAVAETPNLELLEPRPREQLWPLIERAAAVVNTSEQEGMPNVFLEGWARGVPALTLHHDPDSLISRERLGGHAEGSMDRLTELTEGMWRSRGDQREVAERCRDYVRRAHSLDAVASAWERVLWGG